MCVCVCVRVCVCVCVCAGVCDGVMVCCDSVLSLRGEEVEETDLDGIAADQQTHFCSNTTGSGVLQVQQGFF